VWAEEKRKNGREGRWRSCCYKEERRRKEMKRKRKERVGCMRERKRNKENKKRKKEKEWKVWAGKWGLMGEKYLPKVTIATHMAMDKTKPLSYFNTSL
jgi:hypothetical protein